MKAGTRVTVQLGSSLKGDKPEPGVFVNWIVPGCGQGVVDLDSGDRVHVWAIWIGLERE